MDLPNDLFSLLRRQLFAPRRSAPSCVFPFVRLVFRVLSSLFSSFLF